MTISEERRNELDILFWNESNDEETKVWRDDLTEEEEKLVDEWDRDYAKAFQTLVNELAEKKPTVTPITVSL